MSGLSDRFDYHVIAGIIEPRSKVLDLGCGDGSLLQLLEEQKGVKGTGIEINEQAIYECMAKGLTVSHWNFDSGLEDYSSKRFDYVILNESIQQVLHPKKVIMEALRVGKKVIVGIPNFVHLQARFQIFFKGRVPVTKELPYEWYDTPNLRFLGLRDFSRFCRKNQITVLKKIGIGNNKIVRIKPNLFANVGLFVLEKLDQN